MHFLSPYSYATLSSFDAVAGLTVLCPGITGTRAATSKSGRGLPPRSQQNQTNLACKHCGIPWLHCWSAQMGYRLAHSWFYLPCFVKPDAAMMPNRPRATVLRRVTVPLFVTSRPLHRGRAPVKRFLPANAGVDGCRLLAGGHSSVCFAHVIHGHCVLSFLDCFFHYLRRWCLRF